MKNPEHHHKQDTKLYKVKNTQILKDMSNADLKLLGESITPEVLMGVLMVIMADCVNERSNLGIVPQLATQIARCLEIKNKLTERDMEKASEEKLNKAIINCLGVSV